jgi:hypothetical protein
MPDIIHIQDLTHAEISELLTVNAAGLSNDQATALQNTVNEISNTKRASDALRRLYKLDEAA